MPRPSGPVQCHMDVLLERRGMTLTRLAELTGISVVNLSILKNGHAKAIRFTTLIAVCEALECTVGELLE